MEIADVYCVHVRTVQSWHSNGLKHLEGSNNPYLILGKDVKEYLIKEQQKKKVTLKSNEFYCMKCKKAVVPVKVIKVIRKIKLGGNNQAVTLSGVCPICACKVNRFDKEKSSIIEK